MNVQHTDTENPSGKNTSEKDQVHLLSYGQDLPAELAKHIIQKHKSSLPDLTGINIFFPTSQSNNRFRKLLLSEANKAGYEVLIGPEIETLTEWITHSDTNTLPVITEQQRELMLVESLVRYPHLYGKASPWAFAESLLTLFDELSERDIHLPENFNDFLAQVDKAYRKFNNGNTLDSEALTGEALLVHTLWQAWQQQMKDSGFVDRHTAYLLKLNDNEQQSQTNHAFYLAGFSQFSPAEISWLSTSIKKGNTFLWLQCSKLPGDEIEYHPDVAIRQILTALDTTPLQPEPANVVSHCLDTIFDTGNTPLRDRAREFSQSYPDSPIHSHLSLFEARSSEHEAMAIDLQTRQWLIEGRKNIGIVTENRRLARRVRALLERANIQLQDAAGWALSTTSASATLERWLETVEEDFAYQPLLDLLKSPFFFPSELCSDKERPDKDREDFLATTFLFEQSIVLRENINRGLDRYFKHIRYRQGRLTEELAAAYDDIQKLLEIVSVAAKPLLPFLDNKNYKPSLMLDALTQSLALLGMKDTFSRDDAGIKILEEITRMQAATLGSSLHMNWTDFRGWLGRTLEQFNFRPNIQFGNVQLMSLSQNPLHRYDALIIAGAEREYLPGITNSSPFFNDGVRIALGLKSRNEMLSQKFYQFRRLLELADTIVITRRTEHESEHVVCSPWVERIKSFHLIAYGQDLVNETLQQLAGHSDTLVTDKSTPLPAPITANPGISINEELMPEHISANAYQQLINCPFQFFAARCLKLQPQETIKEMLEKADYGERVHLCLQAFHSGANNLPGPFNKPLGANTREEAIRLLVTIADAVFARDLEDNFLHRAWLKRWHELIPAYIDWQMEQQQEWKVDVTESEIVTHLDGMDIPIRGRIDRIDVRQDATDSTYDILDYKTGSVSKKDEVLSGESIQLPFYVLLAQQSLQKTASRAEYISIDKGTVRSRSAIDGDKLHELTRQVGQRLVKNMNEIKNGKTMHAWGDHIACRYCHMAGVCRRESWSDTDPG